MSILTNKTYKDLQTIKDINELKPVILNDIKLWFRQYRQDLFLTEIIYHYLKTRGVVVKKRPEIRMTLNDTDLDFVLN